MPRALLLRSILLVLLGSASAGCGSLGYLYQAGRGQLAIANRARPVTDVIADSRTPPRVKTLLSEIDRIKAFGENRGIKPTHNYREYVELDRPAAVWVVSACDPLRFDPKKWEFLVVGSFTYLGWFDLENAKTFAQQLKTQGLDVHLRGASAYSTLGWFEDPILSTMIPDGEDAFGELVNVVIHESVHATVYVSGQSYFNESLASFIADELTPLYFDEVAKDRVAEKAAWLKSETEGRERRAQFQKAYFELRELYDSQKPDPEKLAEKTRILSDLKQRLGLRNDVNNASLVQFRTYGVGRKEFEALFSACGKDWGRFFRAVGRLTENSFGSPQQEDFAPVLKNLADKGC